MDEFQQRVVDEAIDLGVKITKLADFVKDSEKLDKADPVQRDLLKRQLSAMRVYAYVLGERIKLF